MQNNQSHSRIRGIYLLPNLFTLAALFAGFYAIIAAMQGLFALAAIAIFISLVFDGLDGRVARLTGSTSAFGAEMDSLSDMVCFGVAPALVMYFWSLHLLGKPGWLIAFVYVACTALRLARFNTQLQEKTSSRYSQGLTTTMAAGWVASLIWVCCSHEVFGGSHRVILPLAIFALFVALLKVSKIRYRSFKDLDLRGKVPFVTIILIVLVVVLVAFDPADLLLLIFSVYGLSGPLMTVLGVAKRRKRKHQLHVVSQKPDAE